MILRTFIAAAWLALLPGAALVLAQTDGEQQEPQAGASQGADNEASPPVDSDRQPTATGRAPSDYRPSEQISEDLSVSFPVDI